MKEKTKKEYELEENERKLIFRLSTLTGEIERDIGLLRRTKKLPKKLKNYRKVLEDVHYCSEVFLRTDYQDKYSERLKTELEDYRNSLLKLEQTIANSMMDALANKLFKYFLGNK